MPADKQQPIEVIKANWPAPSSIQAMVTTRLGGVAEGPYASSNIASHCGDNIENVQRNRSLLVEQQNLPNEPLWLEQVHGTTIAELAESYSQTPVADACVGSAGDGVIAIQTADCLPVLFCSRDGERIGGAHAGWRSLVNGVLERTVTAMAVPPEQIMAWFGPAIGASAFEVGDEVRDEFVRQGPVPSDAFAAAGPNKWLADIYSLARTRLESVGVSAIFGGEFCTYSDPERFYSYRRDKVTGRMVSLIWKQHSP